MTIAAKPGFLPRLFEEPQWIIWNSGEGKGRLFGFRGHLAVSSSDILFNGKHTKKPVDSY
jgi:hypothetical protein